MKIGVPNEIHQNECRVAMTPNTAGRLQKLGYECVIEAGAGARAKFSDDAYRDAGVTVVTDTKQLWADSDIILKVRAPEEHPGLGIHEAELLHEGTTLISFIWPAQNEDLMDKLKARNVTVMAMDSVPRISRAQKLDALSSMANIAGYRAVIEASNHFGRFFTGQITAAGKVPPAKIMVIGAGVAGLAAVGTANGLGAIVRAFDTRPEVKQQVESMGAQFLELEFEEEEDGSTSGGYAKVMSKEFIEAEMTLFREQAKEVDIIITTALIPGKPAPKLILADMVELMKDGSVVVDLAAEQGGNCELTSPGEVVVRHGVTLIGYMDLPSRLPTQSSQLYGSNLCHLLSDMTPEKDGNLTVDMEDDVIRGTTVIHQGEITWPPPPIAVSAAPAQTAPAEAPVAEKPQRKKSGIKFAITLIVAALALLGLGNYAPPEFMQHFTVFVLSCFIGYWVVWNVTPALHTPLMSVTNAISSVIIIGAILQIGSSSGLIMILATVSVLIASINIGGGFFVTQRMLQMFRKEE
ncbi:MAG: Re/Si-specific NAD(P)(+) transhydrogenase subunit alpha [Gammaproteobacteria bacterium]|nr:Re/Si-specific NAD(P)(+) transhydrogenase subunit alpha [Gammaproteobacteria bacterium]